MPENESSYGARPMMSANDQAIAQLTNEVRGLSSEIRGVRTEVAEVKELLNNSRNPMEGVIVRVALLESWRHGADRRALFHTVASVINFLVFVIIVFWMLYGNR